MTRIGFCRSLFALAAAVLALAGAVVWPGCGDSSADSFVAAALGKMDRQEYEAAARLLEQAVRKDPANATAHCNLGVAYAQIARAGPAITALERAGELCPKDPRPHEFLGHIYLRAGKWNEARKAFEQAHQRFLVSPRITTARALVEFQAGEFQLALVYLQKALDLDPNYGPALYDMGFLYTHNPRHRSEAAKYFRRYLQTMEKTEAAANDPRVLIARAFLERGVLGPVAPLKPRAESPASPSAAPTTAASPSPAPSHAAPTTPAVATVSQPPSEPLRAKPPPVAAPARSPVQPLVTQARAALRKDEYEVALVLLKDAVDKDPQNADALWELAQLYQTLSGRTEQAARAFSLFRARFPQDPRVSAMPGAAARAESPAARRAVNNAEAIKLWGKGLELQRKDDMDGAIARYKKALELDKNLHSAWYNLGLAYKSKNDLPAALDAFTRALNLKPDLVGAAFMAAVTYWDLKDKEKAAQQLAKALRIDPGYAPAHFLRGMIYRDGGQSSLARRHLERYLQLAPNGAHAQTAKQWLAALPAS
ncbi:MAG: tetratricopeptide repeat protein [Verrucomicrobiota bacterium]|nr:tetratricopeptide repeat protein [Verrucomicrobiota bacterium]